MKKFLTFCLMISISFNLYLYNIEYVVRDDFNDEEYDSLTPEETVNDQVKLAQAAVAKKQDCKPKKLSFLRKKTSFSKKKTENKEESNFSEVEIREKYEASYNKWLEESENFFLDDLGLSAEQIATYRRLSNRRQNELSEYFNQKNLNAKKDNPSTYMLNSDDTIFLGKVAQKYENLLKESFGDSSYKKHKEFINKHNDNIMTDEFVQVVEF